MRIAVRWFMLLLLAIAATVVGCAGGANHGTAPEELLSPPESGDPADPGEPTEPTEPTEPSDPEVPPAPPGEPPTPESYSDLLKVSMNCDFYDIIRNPGWWDLDRFEEEVAAMMRASRDAGVDRILYRVDAIGEVIYPSEVMTVFNGTNQAEARGLNDDYSRRALRVVTDFDPLETCIRYAHAEGMELYAWVTPFDRGYGAAELQDEWLAERPLFQWITRTAGAHPSYASGDVFKGMPCFAYAEVRARQVAEFDELTRRYDLDGFCVSWRKHGSGPGNFEAGFNAPVIRDYIARWGQSPLELQIGPATEAGIRFSTLKSEYVTQLLREVRDVTGSLPVAVMNSGHCATPESTYRYVDYDAIERDRLTDEEWVWRATPRSHGLPRTLWHNMYNWSVDLSDDQYERLVLEGLRRAYGQGCDGISLHEQAIFEFHPNVYGRLKRLLDMPAGG